MCALSFESKWNLLLERVEFGAVSAFRKSVAKASAMTRNGSQQVGQPICGVFGRHKPRPSAVLIPVQVSVANVNPGLINPWLINKGVAPFRGD